MKKKTKRKAFNFLRSYFDVLNELTNDKDKLDFLTAIINKQFLDEDPKDLNFIVNLCYESQRHQIETSVKGWERATKDSLNTTPPTTLGTTPPTTLGTDPKEEEEEVKEEEEEEEEVKYNTELKSIDFVKLLEFINSSFNKNFKSINDKAKKSFNARLKNYPKEIFKTVINNLKKDNYHLETGFKYITPEYIAREKTIDLHSQILQEVKQIKIDNPYNLSPAQLESNRIAKLQLDEAIRLKNLSNDIK
jgi:uncharacterized phage protein (TIGR02220 family)